jgi:phage-related protein
MIPEMNQAVPKKIVWVASSLDEVRQFPEVVRHAVGFALFEAQLGGKHPSASPLRGFGGAGVLEVVTDHHGDTFRSVYTVRFAEAVYVLHAFEKKAKRGIETPKREIAVIRSRLRMAEEIHRTGERRQKGTSA